MVGAVPALTPEEILRLDADEADQLITALESSVPERRTLHPVAAGSAEEALVFGDTHGDWRSSLEVVERSGVESGAGVLVGLGDYIDRPPPDCGAGSVANALYLLGVAARHPDRVVLIQGNHEGVSRVTPYPHHLPEEVRLLWGPDGARYGRIMSLLERGPLAATTESGAFLCHAGFPRELPAADWRTAFDAVDEARFCEITWAECDASTSRRGAAVAWTERDLDRFLESAGLRMLLRGHDPDLTGRWLYGGRALTLQTTRSYERLGGVIVARVPLKGGSLSSEDVRVDHLSTEGRRFPLPRP